MKINKRIVSLTLAAALCIGGAMTSMAMPGDVGGTWNADPEYVSQPQNPYWDGYTAHWNAAQNADHYEVELHRGGSVASTDTTSNTHISYHTLMQQSGEYTFRVRAIAGDGSASDWSDYSSNHHVSGFDADKHNNATYEPSQGPGANPYSPASTSYGWVRDNDGLWRWRDSNGQYVTDAFRNIDGNTYYFGDNGIMFTGWLSLNSATYYFYDNGIMAVGNQEIGGRVYHFSEQPGPNYGEQIQ